MKNKVTQRTYRMVIHYFYDHVLKLVQLGLELGYFHRESVTIDPHGDVSSDYYSLKN